MLKQLHHKKGLFNPAKLKKEGYHFTREAKGGLVIKKIKWVR